MGAARTAARWSPEREKHGEHMAGSSTLRVEGDVAGQIVVGDHNVVINAQQGSSVALRSDGPPAVRRRDRPAGRALPRRPAALLGREGELATVDEWLGAGHLVQVYGPPGIGKSALLRHYAAEQTARERDLVYLPAAGLPVEDVVQELFHACFETEDYKPEPARMRRLMGTVQALLVVDDFAGTPQDLAALADAAPGCDLLVAGVDRCPSEEARTLRLGGLPEAAALDLLARELRRTPEGEERATVRELTGAVRGHPLTLVQAAAAVRAGESAGEGVETAGDGAGMSLWAPDEAARAVGLAEGLDDIAVRLLRVLSALAPLPVSSRLLDALSGGPSPTSTVDAPASTTPALQTLENLHLVERDGPAWRGRGELAALVARRTGRAPDPGEFAAAVTRWLGASATRQQAAAEAPVIRRVLTDAARRQDHTAVRDLARAAAPVLARSLRWGSWRLVLEHGGAAAVALGSAADHAYFTHEEEVRRKALGLAALVAGVAVGGGAGAGAAALHNSLGAGGKGTVTAGKSGLSALATNPAVIGAAVAALIGGGVFVSMADADDGHAAVAGPSAPAASVYSAYSPPPRPHPSYPLPSGPRPSVSSPTASDPASVPRPATPDGSGQCVRFEMPAPTFGEVRAHERETHEVVFDAWLPCDDENTLAVSDKTNWEVRRTACPPPAGSRECRFTVTFKPGAPGTYHARVTIRDDWGQDDLYMEVTGVGVAAAPSSPVGPSAPPSETDVPVSPPPSETTPGPGPTEPTPSTT
ncbi:ATP-binding protein [Streptomyces sp. NPDC047072]|uniref:ATP-binding protein n=1 Tax=Streptomyces sp. NPDC047072 TaxID=3154809 RepID=UPI0033DDCA54